MSDERETHPAYMSKLHREPAPTETNPALDYMSDADMDAAHDDLDKSFEKAEASQPLTLSTKYCGASQPMCPCGLPLGHSPHFASVGTPVSTQAGRDAQAAKDAPPTPSSTPTVHEVEDCAKRIFAALYPKLNWDWVDNYTRDDCIKAALAACRKDRG